MADNKNNSKDNIKNKKVDFGFKDIDISSKPSLVQNIFSSVSKKYDLMNDLMSGGLHRVWKNTLINHIYFRNNLKLLDMAAGTGDIGIRSIKLAEKKNININVFSIDLTYKMIHLGKNRSIDKGFFNNLYWINGDGEKLPFFDKTFDVYTNVFGIRNVSNMDLALSEAYRVLKPGSQFLFLEFNNNVPIFNDLYNWYSFNIIPKIGKIILNDEKSYRYLVESIRRFPDRDIFIKKCEIAGFKKVTYKSLNGEIATIYSGWRI